MANSFDSASVTSAPERALSRDAMSSLASPLTRRSSYEFRTENEANQLPPQLGDVLVVGGCGFVSIRLHLSFDAQHRALVVKEAC